MRRRDFCSSWCSRSCDSVLTPPWECFIVDIVIQHRNIVLDRGAKYNLQGSIGAISINTRRSVAVIGTFQLRFAHMMSPRDCKCRFLGCLEPQSLTYIATPYPVMLKELWPYNYYWR